jgi:HSP20 family protein
MLPIVRRRTWNESPVANLHREMDRMFQDFWPNGEPESLTGAYPVDIREDENHVTVEAELPGFKRDEINVTLERGVLRIEAERQAEQQEGQKHLSERRYTRVARAFSLPSTVDESKVDASLNDGVLTLKLNKREEAKPRRIEVK